MVEMFGTPYDQRVTAEPITTLEQMDNAIYALYWYRWSLGLEMAIAFRRRLGAPWVNPEEYSTCSLNT